MATRSVSANQQSQQSQQNNAQSSAMAGASCFKDKEILNDALIGEKQICSAYNTFAGECSCEQLKNAFLSVLDDTHRIQYSLFRDMQSRGWYPTEQAEKQKIQQTKQKLCQQG
ncbi:MAG: spore coat protein [Oscillospiraceae bacterium]|jgi:spore coat protein CotF|nr:spore coat protein [Oscillospiraceae bacterium]